MSSWVGGEPDQHRWEDHVHGLDFEASNRQRIQEREQRIIEQARRDSRRRWALTMLVLLVMGGSGFAAWHYRDQIRAWLPGQDAPSNQDSPSDQEAVIRPTPEQDDPVVEAQPMRLEQELEDIAREHEERQALREKISRHEEERDKYKARLVDRDAALRKLEDAYNKAKSRHDYLRRNGDTSAAFSVSVLMQDIVAQAKSIRLRRAHDQRLYDGSVRHIERMQAELAELSLP